MPESRAKRGPARSRKGCPECRARKIKCDETRPECAQCVKSGRVCRIIDGLFRPHSLSTPTKNESVSRVKQSLGLAHEDLPSPGQTNPARDLDPSTKGPGTPISARDRLFPDSPANCQSSLSVGGIIGQSSPPVQSFPSANLQISSPAVAQDHPTVTSHAASQTSTISASMAEETNQDRSEVAFFLRHFAEIGGQWMDICTGPRSYFSQYVVQLASQSPLLRYSACAMAAKQMGQMKDSTQATNVTPRSSMTASLLLRPSMDMDFEWYGAKYYEKAILLMARQISHDRSIIQIHLSPGEIYLSPSSDYSHLDDHQSTSSAFRILAACILCSYEDLSATMRAWTGHLDGINKLLRPHLDLPISPDNFYRVPQSLRALDVSFWYFALNDMLNSLTLRQPCRINTDDVSLWQKMGLPLDASGQLAVEYIAEGQQEMIFFKALIRLLCKLVTRDSGETTKWSHIDMEFTQWYSALPQEFLAPVTQTLPQSANESPEPPEIWFGSETCAIAMLFYHMARILLLVSQPQQTHSVSSNKPRDLLSAYNALQGDLIYHAMEIIPIAHGMTSITVQKYMLQPLYIAGRCLSSWNERQEVMGLLRRIEGTLGLATEYRVRDLADEWGISYERLSPQADDGYGNAQP